MDPLTIAILAATAIKGGLNIADAHAQNNVNAAEVENAGWTGRNVSSKHVSPDWIGPFIQGAALANGMENEAAKTAALKESTRVNPGGYFSPYNPRMSLGTAANAGNGYGISDIKNPMAFYNF